MSIKESVIETPLIAEVLSFTRIPEQDESYPIVKLGVETLLLEAFGGGFTCGSALLKY